MGGKDAKAKAEAEATHEYEVMSPEGYRLVSMSLEIAISHFEELFPTRKVFPAVALSGDEGQIHRQIHGGARSRGSRTLMSVIGN